MKTYDGRLIPIPPHILDAANAVSTFFALQNISEWKLSGCQNRDENMKAAPLPPSTTPLSSSLRNLPPFGSLLLLGTHTRDAAVNAIEALDKATVLALSNNVEPMSCGVTLHDYIRELLEQLEQSRRIINTVRNATTHGWSASFDIDAPKFDKIPGIDRGPVHDFTPFDSPRTIYGPDGQEGRAYGSMLQSLPMGWTWYKQMPKTFKDYAAFRQACEAYEGPEAIVLDGSQIMNCEGTSWEQVLRYNTIRSVADTIKQEA